MLRKLTSLTHVASWSGRRVRPPRAQGRRWPSCPCCMCSVAPRPRPPRTSRASGAPLLALGRYGRSNGLMQMALSQRCWSWLAAISGGKPLVMDSTSTLGGYLIIGAGCSGSWDQRDRVFSKSMKTVPHLRLDLPGKSCASLNSAGKFSIYKLFAPRTVSKAERLERESRGMPV